MGRAVPIRGCKPALTFYYSGMAEHVRFSHPDWEPLPKGPPGHAAAWRNRQGVELLLHHPERNEALRQRMPSLADVREFYRRTLASDGSGLIECDLMALPGLTFIRVIGKKILQRTRAVYRGLLVVPVADSFYTFSVLKEEKGVTGVRERTVWTKVGKELEAQGYAPEEGEDDAGMLWRNPKSRGTVRWAQDPYSPDFNGPCLRNMSDAPEYDLEFPDHPLTQVREALRCLSRNLALTGSPEPGCPSPA